MKKVLLFLIALSCVIEAQSYYRVMTWNIRDYTAYNPSASDPNWLDFDNPHLKKMIETIQPDILVCEEVRNQESVNQLKNFVLSSGYAQADFVESTNMNCVLFYRSSVFTSLGNIVHRSDTRPINEFPIVHKTTNDTLIIFGVHLKANDFVSDNTQNKQRRLIQANTIRQRTKAIADKHFIVVGDFNTLSSTEPAFTRLIDKSEPGYLIDPLNSNGEWANNSAFASVHTYSSKSLNVRFDMILVSEALTTRGGIDLMNGSYNVFGNDGNHFNKAVNDGSNYWVFDGTIGTALVTGSDHLPVYADFYFGVKTDLAEETEIPSEFYLGQNYPNPFNPETSIEYSIPASMSNAFVSLKIFDLIGREITTLVSENKRPGNYKARFSIQNEELCSGIYFYQLKVGNFTTTKKMALQK